jgi:hypothetical protein
LFLQPEPDEYNSAILSMPTPTMCFRCEPDCFPFLIGAALMAFTIVMIKLRSKPYFKLQSRLSALLGRRDGSFPGCSAATDQFVGAGQRLVQTCLHLLHRALLHRVGHHKPVPAGKCVVKPRRRRGIPAGSGKFQFTDAQAANNIQHYYRVRTL